MLRVQYLVSSNSSPSHVRCVCRSSTYTLWNCCILPSFLSCKLQYQTKQVVLTFWGQLQSVSSSSSSRLANKTAQVDLVVSTCSVIFFVSVSQDIGLSRSLSSHISSFCPSVRDGVQSEARPFTHQSLDKSSLPRTTSRQRSQKYTPENHWKDSGAAKMLTKFESKSNRVKGVVVPPAIDGIHHNYLQQGSLFIQPNLC